MFQCDKDVVEDSITGLVTHIGGSAIDLDRMYCIATTVDFWNGCEVLLEYFKLYPEQTYTEEMSFGTIHSVLVSYFAGNVWAQLLHVLDQDGDCHISTDEFKKVDLNDDGSIDVKEMLQIMAKKGGFEVDASELEFALQVMRSAGDGNNDGKLTLDELNSAVAAHP
jgi:Ca2+-binding EF-hand superfamily protein